MKIRSVLRVAVPVLAMGCMSEDIKLRENDVLMPAVRIVLPERGAPTEDGETRRGPSRSLELAAAGAVDDVSPPDSGHFSLFEGTVAFRRSTFGTDVASFDFLFGAGYNRFDIDVIDGPLMLDRDVDRFGPMVGAVVSVQPVPRVTLYGRGTYMYLVPDGTSGQAEAGVRFGLTDNVHVFGAWRHWRYRLENLTGSARTTDIDVKAEGLGFGVELVF